MATDHIGLSISPSLAILTLLYVHFPPAYVHLSTSVNPAPPPRAVLSRLDLSTHRCLQVPLLAISSIAISDRMTGSTDDAAHGGEGSILLMVAPSGSRAVFPPSASRRRRRDRSLPSCRRRHARSPPLVHLKTGPGTNRRDESVDTVSRGSSLVERDGGAAILAHTYREKKATR